MLTSLDRSKKLRAIRYAIQSKKKTPLTLEELDQTKLPILNAKGIIQLLGIDKKLKSIHRLSSVGAEYWNELYLPPIHQYLESVQLAPASTAHHHSGPGGLAIHTFDVIDRALRQRKSYELPLNAGPELIFSQEHVWTYAIFLGALLHDIGKMVTNTVLMLDNGKAWNPHKQSILESGATNYQILFNRYPYKYHTQMANSFFHIVPDKGRGWLAQYPDIFTELCAWLYGDFYEFGMIGQIIRYADGESVAANLKIGGERIRFTNAPEIPLVEKLMTALRDELESKKLKINGSEGSSGWCVGQYTYLVCGTVAESVRSYLQKMGSTDIPSDNTRLFDTWQEHGYAISNPEGGAIWNIKVDNRFQLTVLKFETSRLFHPSKQPGVFQRNIEVVEKLDSVPAIKSEAAPKIQDSNKESRTGADLDTNAVPAHNTIAETDNSGEPSSATDPFSDVPALKCSKDEESPQGVASDTEYNQVNNTNTVIEKEGANCDLGPNTKGDGSYKKASKVPDAFQLSDPKISDYFLIWINEGLDERKFAVNNSSAFIHIAKEGTLLVTPIAFKKFIWAYNLSCEGENITKQVTRIQDRLKASMEKMKLHRRTKAGLNIHTYQINGEQKTTKIKCWLLPTEVIFKDSKVPSINPVLENMSGFSDS